MASYAYIIGGTYETANELLKNHPELVDESNITIEKAEDAKAQPKLEELMETLCQGDTLIVPELVHIGNCLADVIHMFQSLELIGAKLVIGSESDNAMIKSLGGLTSAASTIRQVSDLQQRLLKRRQIEGIKLAKQKDAALPVWDTTKKKYKGRVGYNHDHWLQAMGCSLRGMTPSEIAKDMNVSRGSVYNFFKKAEALYSPLIKAYQTLLEMPGFKLLPSTTYSTIPQLIIDLLFNQSGAKQHLIRDAQIYFETNFSEVKTAKDMIGWLMEHDTFIDLGLVQNEESDAWRQQLIDFLEHLDFYELDEHETVMMAINNSQSSAMTVKLKDYLDGCGKHGESIWTRLREIAMRCNCEDDAMHALIKFAGIEGEIGLELIFNSSKVKQILGAGSKSVPATLLYFCQDT